MNSKFFTSQGLVWSKAGSAAMNVVFSRNVLQTNITAVTGCKVRPASEKQVLESVLSHLLIGSLKTGASSVRIIRALLRWGTAGSTARTHSLNEY